MKKSFVKNKGLAILFESKMVVLTNEMLMAGQFNEESPKNCVNLMIKVIENKLNQLKLAREVTKWS